jgi:hypothetical protein
MPVNIDAAVPSRRRIALSGRGRLDARGRGILAASLDQLMSLQNKR